MSEELLAGGVVADGPSIGPAPPEAYSLAPDSVTGWRVGRAGARPARIGSAAAGATLTAAFAAFRVAAHRPHLLSASAGERRLAGLADRQDAEEPALAGLDEAPAPSVTDLALDVGFVGRGEHFQ
jgi:hypothetical protein